VNIDYVPQDETCKVLEVLALYSADIMSLSLGIPEEEDYSSIIQTLNSLSFLGLKRFAFGQIAPVDDVLHSAFNLFARSNEDGLELRLFSFPTLIATLLDQSPITNQLKSLQLDFGG
jgi:hypothetical protein